MKLDCTSCGKGYESKDGGFTDPIVCSIPCLQAYRTHKELRIGDMTDDQKKFAREMIEGMTRIAQAQERTAALQEKQMKLALTLSKALLAFARGQRKQSAEERLLDEVESVLEGWE